MNFIFFDFMVHNSLYTHLVDSYIFVDIDFFYLQPYLDYFLFDLLCVKDVYIDEGNDYIFLERNYNSFLKKYFITNNVLDLGVVNNFSWFISNNVDFISR